ncbi:DUF2809 domain-containing protein [Arthrobacter sp. Helios]|uniref:DUF2809 domain-containing protein n=1 Tax=Arthrobacter sp. Helios TaxID=2828862 RepID=UPI002064BA1A|nr:DUF2809 domain-containing protein [Arthrobacter sp. Helios]UPO78043.1 DUF2809 domain-containing protein [Arthrobacter sp. Helios]
MPDSAAPAAPPAAVYPFRRPAVRGLWFMAAAAAVVAGGLAARGLPGLAGDAAGGVLYAVLVYLLAGLAALVLLRRSAAPLRLAATAVVLCWLVELFQLTPWPARLGEAWPPLHLVFGSTFNAWDLAAYAAGAAAAAAADLLLSRPDGRVRRAAALSRAVR